MPSDTSELRQPLTILRADPKRGRNLSELLGKGSCGRKRVLTPFWLSAEKGPDPFSVRRGICGALVTSPWVLVSMRRLPLGLLLLLLFITFAASANAQSVLWGGGFLGGPWGPYRGPAIVLEITPYGYPASIESAAQAYESHRLRIPLPPPPSAHFDFPPFSPPPGWPGGRFNPSPASPPFSDIPLIPAVRPPQFDIPTFSELSQRAAKEPVIEADDPRDPINRLQEFLLKRDDGPIWIDYLNLPQVTKLLSNPQPSVDRDGNEASRAGELLVPFDAISATPSLLWMAREKSFQLVRDQLRNRTAANMETLPAPLPDPILKDGVSKDGVSRDQGSEQRIPSQGFDSEEPEKG